MFYRKNLFAWEQMLRLVAGTVTSEYVISTQFTMRAKSTTQ